MHGDYFSISLGYVLEARQFKSLDAATCYCTSTMGMTEEDADRYLQRLRSNRTRESINPNGTTLIDAAH